MLFMAIVGCRPRGILSSNEMRDVLYDLHRADGVIQVAGYNYSHDQELAGYYKNILDKHGITQADFDSSLTWYTNNPQIFNKVYPKVIERLENDYEFEKKIREANREEMLANRAANKTNSKQQIRQLRNIDELQRELLYGFDNSWKTWTPEDFSEKSVKIFGQLEKK